MAHPGLDNEQLHRALRGDIDAFAAVFEAYRPKLQRVACRLVGRNDGDDVVMETYLKAWRSLDSFGGRASLSTWLCRIAHNCALDLLRRQSRRDRRQVSADDPQAVPLIDRVPDTSIPSPDRQVQVTELGTRIEAAMAQLSSQHRTTVRLREIDGLSYKEVAAATGVSIGTVMSRLFHARRKLRRILEADEQWQS